MTDTIVPKGHTATREMRVESADSLDTFWTPPWGTRALFECALPGIAFGGSCLDPCAGTGLMAEVLKEYFGEVFTADVHDYGYPLDWVNDYSQPRPRSVPGSFDWVVMNPPFNQAESFLQRALGEARQGVAMLLRTSWKESQGRYDRIFSVNPPTFIATFAERLAMFKDRWVPNGSTATSYSWFIWVQGRTTPTQQLWVPTGTRDAFSYPRDLEAFAHLIGPQRLSNPETSDA